MVEDLELAADAFFVDEGPEFGQEVGGEAEVGAGGAAVGKHCCVALGLHGAEVVLLFDLADFGGDVHSLGEQIDELVVDLVDVLAVLPQQLCVGGLGRGVAAQGARGDTQCALSFRGLCQKLRLSLCASAFR